MDLLYWALNVRRVRFSNSAGGTISGLNVVSGFGILGSFFTLKTMLTQN